jgi:hypothetical protein
LIGFKEKSLLIGSDSEISPSYIFHPNSNKFLMQHKIQDEKIFICYKDDNNIMEVENDGKEFDFEISLIEFLTNNSK